MMESQMKKNMENELETGEHIGVIYTARTAA